MILCWQQLKKVKNQEIGQMTLWRLVMISCRLSSSPTQLSLTRVRLSVPSGLALELLRVLKPDVKMQLLLPSTVLLDPIIRLFVPDTPFQDPTITLLQLLSSLLNACSFSFTKSVLNLVRQGFSLFFPQLFIRSNCHRFKATWALRRVSQLTGTPGTQIKAGRNSLKRASKRMSLMVAICMQVISNRNGRYQTQYLFVIIVVN